MLRGEGYTAVPCSEYHQGLSRGRCPYALQILRMSIEGEDLSGHHCLVDRGGDEHIA